MFREWTDECYFNTQERVGAEAGGGGGGRGDGQLWGLDYKKNQHMDILVSELGRKMKNDIK